MKMSIGPRDAAIHARHGLLPLAALLALTGCASSGAMDDAAPTRLAAQLRSSLGRGWPSPEYQEARDRLEEMGPEVDSVLVALIEDTHARIAARADALVLLADRRSPLALPMLSRALGYQNEELRSAAVLGLNVLSATSDDAVALIRAATRDPSRQVRLNALQSLDIREVDTIRALLERENDPEVRQVALQLLSIAESRGAPLDVDLHGTLRTAGDDSEPQIAFRSANMDTTAVVVSGDLRIELPAGHDIPLASSALVVDHVVPAFFAPDRSAVVVENGGRIQVVEIATRTTRTLGDGIAPRLIPFTYEFVFLRERVGEQPMTPRGREVLYDVYQSSFNSTDIKRIGILKAWIRDDVRSGASPVRWMVVGDSGEGFALRGENVETFPLPAPVWNTGISDASTTPD